MAVARDVPVLCYELGRKMRKKMKMLERREEVGTAACAIRSP